MMNAVETKKTIMELTDQILHAEKTLIDAKTDLNNVLCPIMWEVDDAVDHIQAQAVNPQDSEMLKKLDEHLYFLDLYLQDIREITRKLQL